ncbi:DUF4231 domain-containing protein [Tenacibaculum aestuarii]|uniref:DUF4231 domain-containing protein n=1 Tax=Tenacibaculum aestuarii TaxID=362781 RepID=UPI003892EE7A
MGSEQYINERLNNQIDWHDKKSYHNKKLFYTFHVLEVFLALLIPFLNSITDEKSLWSYKIISFISLTIAIISTILSLSKFQTNWVQYRLISETLKSEKFLYLTKSPPYNQGEAYNTLVKRIEGIILKENSKWFSSQSFKQKKNLKL